MDDSYPVKSYKFLKIYSSLNEIEKTEFNEFCRLKFLRKGRNLAKFADNLINGTFSSGARAAWNRHSELTRIIEDFLLLKYLQSNKEERNAHLLEIYNSRPLGELVESQFHLTSKLIEKHKFTERTFFNLHRMHMAYCVHQLQNNKFLSFAKHFRKQSEYVTAHFLTELYSIQTEFDQQKLENVWHDWLANETILNATDNESVIQSFKENLPDIIDHIEYTYYLYRAFDEPEDSKSFFKARKLFSKLFPTLNKKYSSSAYQSFINYCINRTNNADFSFNRVLFDIYNEKLARGFDEDIRYKNYPTNNFRDYVIVGLRLKEYDWVEKFIKEYGEILPDDYKPDEINITRAMLYLARNEYDKALRILEKTKRKNYLHYGDVSDMKLRIYYETDNLVEAFDELVRLNKYLSTNEAIPKQRKVRYEKFVAAFRKLLKLKENFSEDSLTRLELYLEKNPDFFRRNWIQEKVKEMGKA